MFLALSWRQTRENPMTTMIPERQTTSAAVANATIWTSAISLARMIFQAAVLILSARLLGVESYGLISAVVAISLLLGPWSGLGYDFVALRAVSQDSGVSGSYFRLGIRMILSTSFLLVVATTAIVGIWFDDQYPVSVVALILVAELVFLRGTELIAKILQGNDRFFDMAIARLSNSAARLAVLVPIAISGSGITAVQWAWAYALAAIVSFVFCAVLMRRTVEPDGVVRRRSRDEDIDGLHFCSGITSGRLSSEFDKAMTLSLADAASAGIYGAGFRLVTSMVTPVISFVSVVSSSLFRMNAYSEQRGLGNQALVLCGIAAVYGAIVSLALWLFLPSVIGVLFGDDYLAITRGLLPLALLPTAMSCRLVGEQAMAALRKLRFRSTTQWVVAVIAVLLNFVLIPDYGWTAAAWVLLAGESCLAILFILAIASARSDS